MTTDVGRVVDEPQRLRFSLSTKRGQQQAEQTLKK